ncbi:MAG: hypothetical protein COX62_00645 [Deltaproteobacteria bacterium CG_4_10_14_0_2_um_filter_43_8]|nr:MAG: hypothetical protein COV43_06045 [Deltaproteobacteria bacterium CG11_big_fil_rev_8_21_14_0_20_42_23]PJA22153.1 MAG: hypothetical protein COX62_00645 [Deltaproteobacteria bacterium CG_4_10_14_0_2_um_filter_43_8]PJC65131.1 MAG: hypothetical protein CO021_01390 [Deltaproteobacteria bacterium CG_4_9_14_0_2_um_filter_42_21]
MFLGGKVGINPNVKSISPAVDTGKVSSPAKAGKTLAENLAEARSNGFVAGNQDFANITSPLKRNNFPGIFGSSASKQVASSIKTVEDVIRLVSSEKLSARDLGDMFAASDIAVLGKGEA